jgi:hypothetical protein
MDTITVGQPPSTTVLPTISSSVDCVSADDSACDAPLTPDLDHRKDGDSNLRADATEGAR